MNCCFCRHTHVWRRKVSADTVWYLNGENRGSIPDGFEMVGCLICGKVWCEDTKGK